MCTMLQSYVSGEPSLLGQHRRRPKHKIMQGRSSTADIQVQSRDEDEVDYKKVTACKEGSLRQMYKADMQDSFNRNCLSGGEPLGELYLGERASGETGRIDGVSLRASLT